MAKRPPKNQTKLFQYHLPAVRGMYGGMDVFSVMVPLAALPALVDCAPDALGEQFASSRSVDSTRQRAIARCFQEKEPAAALPAILVAADGKVRFSALTPEDCEAASGFLEIGLGTRLVVVDGLHRCAGITEALRRKPEIGGSTVSLIIFRDEGLVRAPQIYGDLKRHQRISAQFIGVAMDQRDEMARLVRLVIEQVEPFHGMVEFAKSSISNRSKKLFTFSSLYQATRTLLSDCGEVPFEERLNQAVHFWRAVARQIPVWDRAQQGEVSPADLRRDCIHAHALALAALARVGKELIRDEGDDWEKRLLSLSGLDWSRENAGLWEGRATIGGRLSKSTSSVVLTANVLKKHLGLALTSEERELEARVRKKR